MTGVGEGPTTKIPLGAIGDQEARIRHGFLLSHTRLFTSRSGMISESWLLFPDRLSPASPSWTDVAGMPRPPVRSHTPLASTFISDLTWDRGERLSWIRLQNGISDFGSREQIYPDSSVSIHDPFWGGGICIGPPVWDRIADALRPLTIVVYDIAPEPLAAKVSYLAITLWRGEPVAEPIFHS